MSNRLRQPARHKADRAFVQSAARGEAGVGPEPSVDAENMEGVAATRENAHVPRCRSRIFVHARVASSLVLLLSFRGFNKV